MDDARPLHSTVGTIANATRDLASVRLVVPQPICLATVTTKELASLKGVFEQTVLAR